MGTTGPDEMGQASIALLLGLLHVLATKGILSREDLDTVVTDAMGELQFTPTNNAIEYVKSLLPEIRKYAAR